MTESLMEFLKTKKEEADSQAGNVEELQAAWQAALTELFDKLRSWLEPARTAGLLDCQSTKIQIVEDRLGSYEAPALKILGPASRTIDILPKARFVIGAEGRVDVRSGPRREMLVHRDGKWSVARQGGRPGRWDYVELSEEAFSELLEMLLS